MTEKKSPESLPIIYPISFGWKLFFTLFIPPLILLFGWVALLPFLEKRTNEALLVIVCFTLGIGFSIFFLYGLVATYKSRIEIHRDRIRKVGVYSNKELLFEEVAGFRVIPTQYVKTMEIVSKISKKKKIKTALVFKNSEGLLKWANENFPNLDAQELKKEVDSFLHDENIGISEEQRLYALNRAKNWAKFINIIAFLTALWGFFRPQPYHIAIWSLILLPVVSILSIYFFAGLIKFNAKQNSPYPTIVYGFLMPVFALSLRALLDWNILDWDSFWGPFVTLTASISVLVLLFAEDTRKKFAYAILPVLFCGVYGYGSTITLNGILDTSSPAIYTAKVADKHATAGKSTSYYLRLSPWGPRHSDEDVSVSEEQYNQYNIGNNVEIRVYKGRLNIPWFFIK